MDFSACQKLQILRKHLAVGVQGAGHEEQAGENEDHAGDEGGDVLGQVEAHGNVLIHPRHRHPHKGQDGRQEHGAGDVLLHGSALGDVGEPAGDRRRPGEEPENPACRRRPVEILTPEVLGDAARDGHEVKIRQRRGQDGEKGDEEHQKREARHALEQIVLGRGHGDQDRDGGEQELESGKAQADEAGHGVHARPQGDGHAEHGGEHGGDFADLGVHVLHVPQADDGIHGPDGRAVEQGDHRDRLHGVEPLLHIAHQIAGGVHQRDAGAGDEDARDPETERPGGFGGAAFKLDAAAILILALAGEKQDEAEHDAYQCRAGADKIDDIVEQFQKAFSLL